MTFSREVFDRIGLFNVSLGRKGNQLFGGEEVDFFRRLLSAGGKGVYQPKALVYHIIDKSRLKKNYFRTLHYKEGVQRALLGDKVCQRSLFVVPLFIFPQFLRSIRNYILSVFSDGRNRSFRKEMTIWYFLGYMQAKINQFKKSGLT